MLVGVLVDVVLSVDVVERRKGERGEMRREESKNFVAVAQLPALWRRLLTLDDITPWRTCVSRAIRDRPADSGSRSAYRRLVSAPISVEAVS